MWYTKFTEEVQQECTAIAKDLTGELATDADLTRYIPLRRRERKGTKLIIIDRHSGMLIRDRFLVSYYDETYEEDPWFTNIINQVYTRITVRKKVYNEGKRIMEWVSDFHRNYGEFVPLRVYNEAKRRLPKNTSVWDVFKEAKNQYYN